MTTTALPSGWSFKTLGELFDFKGGGTPSKKNPAYWGGDIPWASVKDIKNKYLSKTIDSITKEGLAGSAANLAEQGDLVLITRIYPGKAAIASRTIAINQDCKVARPRAGIDTHWAYYLFLATEREFIKRSSGTTVLGISLNDVKEISVPVPSLKDQKRIVAKIDELFSELDNGIAALKTAREQLKVYRQAILKHAFEGKLTAQWREENQDKLETPQQLLARIQQEREARYQQQLEEWKQAVKEWETGGKEGKRPGKPKALKDFHPLAEDVLTKLSELPDSWSWQKLGLLTTGVEYGTSAKSAANGSVPVIRMGNLQNGSIDWADLVYTSDQEEIDKYSLKKNDVLFNRTNSPELVGKTAKYKGEQPALFAGYLIRINQIESIVLADYVNYFLNSHIAKQYGNSVKTDGVNQSNINGEKLQNYPFPFCSIEEQSVIVEMLDEKLSLTDASLQDIAVQLGKAETLRQSILKKAFSGQLVPQDTDDEPASELLARIQVKRKATNTKNTKKARKAK